MDFTTVFDIHGLQLFILNVINQHTRELVLTSCTYHPSRPWIIQQFRNLAIDNDGISGKWIAPIFKEYFEIEIQKISTESLRFNPFVE